MAVTDPAQRLLLETRLAEAKTALHTLQMGQQARVLVDQNGERVEFTPNTVSRLTAYIAELESELGIKGRSLGPMGFIW